MSMQQYADVVTDLAGNALSGAFVSILNLDGSLALLFADDGVSPLANPLSTDANGTFVFRAADGRYKRAVTYLGVTTAVPGEFSLTADILFGTRTVEDKLRETVSVKDFGAIGDGIADDTLALQSTVGLGGDRLPDGTYLSSGFIGITENKKVQLIGNGRASVIRREAATSPAVLSARYSQSAAVKHLDIALNGATSSTTGHAISLIETPGAEVSDVRISGFAGTGTGVIQYATDVNVPTPHVHYKDSIFTGDYAASPNTNGFLVEGGIYAKMRGLTAIGARAFGIEYKNNTKYSVISDSIAVDSDFAFGFGQTTTDDTGVSFSTAANMVARDSGMGWVFGKAKYNVVGHGVVHNSVSTSRFAASAAHGVRADGTANYNSFPNWLFAGDMTYPIRFGASSNYASGCFHNGTGLGVTFTAGAARNAVEVQHPGDRSSILPMVSDTSGNAISSTSGNVVWCHATGEYLGTLSGRWRWRFASSGATPSNPSQQWVFETAGDALPTILNDGAGVAGWLVQAPAGIRGVTYSWVSDYWRVYTGSAGYRFYGTTLRPEADLGPDLGASTFRFKTGYLQNVVLSPPASVTPAANGQMTFELTSDTQLKIKVKGSDGVVRSASLTLA